MSWKNKIGGNRVRRARGGLTALAVLACMALSGSAALADTSPEYFWDGWGTQATGHRHTLSQVSARNLDGLGPLCVWGINDDGSMAGGQLDCGGSSRNGLSVQPLNGSSWRRGHADAGSGHSFRAQEQF